MRSNGVFKKNKNILLKFILRFFFIIYQYLSALVVSGLGCVSIGTVFGFSAILLSQMDEEGLIEAK
jgi:hypothetical protein